MTSGMGTQTGQLTALSERLHNLGPHNQRERLSGISPRFGQEECPLSHTQHASSAQVRCEKLTCHLPIPYHAPSSILGMLSTNSDLLVSKIEIADVEPHQLLTTQCSIIGQEKHQLIA